MAKALVKTDNWEKSAAMSGPFTNSIKYDVPLFLGDLRLLIIEYSGGAKAKGDELLGV